MPVEGRALVDKKQEPEAKARGGYKWSGRSPTRLM
jgi:hypothetical protein